REGCMSRSIRFSSRHAKRLGMLLAISLAFFFRSGSPPPSVVAETQPSDFKNIESPQVHPLALTPDGTRLLAVNTPDHRLSVFELVDEMPKLIAESPIGLEPVSVMARNDHEAWVTNWLSDSVSIVNLTTGNVVRTVDVGDEPTDVVFAGGERQMAFVCVSGLHQIKVFDPDVIDSAAQVIDIPG